MQIAPRNRDVAGGIHSTCLSVSEKLGSVRVHFDVPESVERQFAAEPGGVTRAAIEALAAEGVRSGKLTEFQARQMLGIRSRYEMDGFLKARGVMLCSGLIPGKERQSRSRRSNSPRSCSSTMRPAGTKRAGAVSKPRHLG
jgi:hypothetical protein